MASRLSPRLAALVDALPLRPDARVLEVGCGPGAAARVVADRLVTGHVLAVDRSASAVEQALRAAAGRPDARLRFRHVAAEDLVLEHGEQPYDLVFAFRVGALDGRHPALGARVLARLASVTTPDARLYVDGGDPLRELPLPRTSSSGDPQHLGAVDLTMRPALPAR